MGRRFQFICNSETRRIPIYFKFYKKWLLAWKPTLHHHQTYMYLFLTRHELEGCHLQCVASDYIVAMLCKLFSFTKFLTTFAIKLPWLSTTTCFGYRSLYTYFSVQNTNAHLQAPETVFTIVKREEQNNPAVCLALDSSGSMSVSFSWGFNEVMLSCLYSLVHSCIWIINSVRKPEWLRFELNMNLH